MSTTQSTLWDAWKWDSTLGAWERVTQSPIGKPILQPVTASIRLWYEDDVEFPFHVWDEISNADAASALQVHGLIECEQAGQGDLFASSVIVLVRDWFSKRVLGKLVSTQDGLDLAL